MSSVPHLHYLSETCVSLARSNRISKLVQLYCSKALQTAQGSPSMPAFAHLEQEWSRLLTDLAPIRMLLLKHSTRHYCEIYIQDHEAFNSEATADWMTIREMRHGVGAYDSRQICCQWQRRAAETPPQFNKSKEVGRRVQKDLYGGQSEERLLRTLALSHYYQRLLDIHKRCSPICITNLLGRTNTSTIPLLSAVPAANPSKTFLDLVICRPVFSLSSSSPLSPSKRPTAKTPKTYKEAIADTFRKMN